MQEITANLVDADVGKPSSDEFLNKFRPEMREEIKKREQQRIDERKAYLANLPKNLTPEELQERQQEIDDNLRKQYELKGLNIKKEIGINGKIVGEHKSNLAFIFIGDAEKAENSTKYKVNAPKISMAVGGGLETTYDPTTNEMITIDPRKDQIIGVSSQLHLISYADIDVTGIIGPEDSDSFFLNNRSTVRAEADVLDFSAGEAVLIRSLGRPYNSKGARVMTPGGVHIISGQQYKNKNGDLQTITPPEPMVLGKKLSDVLFSIMEQIGQINTVLLDLCKDVLDLKVTLVAHTHIAAAPGAPVTPSPEIVASVAPSITSKSALAVTNCYSNLINIETLKTNKLTALSPEKFLSDFNRVN